ncbi:hypothetical protein CC86DRAFT_263853, partial [Ophiobolus disseminans]
VQKYTDWSSAQALELLDRTLPLADLEELSIFMCEGIVRIFKLLEPHNKRAWSPPLPPLHHPCWPFWAQYHPANDVIRKLHSGIRNREEHIRKDTLPAAATNHHAYHT